MDAMLTMLMQQNGTPVHDGQFICWLIAVVIFVIGAASYRWTPNYPAPLISLGLAFGFLGLLWPKL